MGLVAAELAKSFDNPPFRNLGGFRYGEIGTIGLAD